MTSVSKETYHVPVRPEGLSASLKSLLTPRYSEVTAVQDVSFAIEAEAVAGLIGTNSMGYVPWQRHPDYLRRISM